MPKRAPVQLQFTSLSRFYDDVSRLNAEQRRARDPRSLALEQIRADSDPDPADLAAALLQQVTDPAKSLVSLTPDEQGDLLIAIQNVEDQQQAVRAWISTHITGPRREAALEHARQPIAEDEVLLKRYVARTYVLRESPRQIARR